MKSMTGFVIVLLLWVLTTGVAGSSDASSAQYRLIGSGPASVSATAGSSAHALYVVGGSGEPVGISASPNHSVVAGGASNQLPTARIFRNGME